MRIDFISVLERALFFCCQKFGSMYITYSDLFHFETGCDISSVHTSVLSGSFWHMYVFSCKLKTALEFQSSLTKLRWCACMHFCHIHFQIGVKFTKVLDHQYATRDLPMIDFLYISFFRSCLNSGFFKCLIHQTLWHSSTQTR